MSGLEPWHQLPAPPLRRYIDRYWGMEGPQPGNGEDSPAPQLPGTGAEAYLFFGRSAQPANLLVARRHGLGERPAGMGGAFLAIRFRAGWAAHLLGLPLAECVDRPLDWHGALGPGGEVLAHRLREVGDTPGRIRLLDQYFLARLAGQEQAPRRDPLVAQGAETLYYAPPGRFSLEDLSHRLGVSRRQLERRFLATEGLSPREFRGLVRLQRAFRLLGKGGVGHTLADVALHSGFYDQAHFTRACQQQLGVTPTTLSRQLAAHPPVFFPPRKTA